MSAPFRLDTARLALRDWREEDWPHFFRHTNTPAVMRWLDGVMDEGQMVRLVERIEGCGERNGYCFWAVERREDGGHLAGELLGFCGLKRADTPGAPVEGELEIGWRLREDAWQRGFAREAAQATLDVGFTRLGAERIVAMTVIDNTASRGLMQRLGMHRREDLDYLEERPDRSARTAIVHAIERPDWAAARSDD